MAFVTAKCPSCQGELQLDDAMEKGFCMYCGSQVVVQQAVNLVRIDSAHMVDNWMRMADKAFDVQNFQEAYDYYTKVVEADEADWKACFFKALSAALLSAKGSVRLLEAKTGIENAFSLLRNHSSLSEPQKDDIRMDLALECKKACDLIYLPAYLSYSNMDYVGRQKREEFFNTFPLMKLCVELGKLALSACNYQNTVPQDVEAGIMKTICACYCFLCDCSYYSETQQERENSIRCYFGLGVPEKQSYIEDYDALVYEVRKREPDFGKIVDRIFRIEPLLGKHYYMDYFAYSDRNETLLSKKDLEFEQRWNGEKEEVLTAYAKNHPENYQRYLEEERKRIEALLKRQEELARQEKLQEKLQEEKREGIRRQIAQQQAIVERHRALFGQGAKLRKEAQDQIEKLQRQLKKIK